MNLRSFTSRTKRSPRGAAAVETAIVLPVMLLMLFGMLEFCRYLLLMQVLTSAARDGCRYALAHTTPVIINGTTYGNADTDVTSIITARSCGQSLTGQTVSLFTSDDSGTNLGTWQGCDPGQNVCVQITGTYSTVVGNLLPMFKNIPVTIRVVMRGEGG
ncbi:MAG: TadE/TadG family type IV pilus assembly protein [Chthoniobacteraceae bacterium]